MDLPERPMDRLLEIMRRLRAPDGCPWDREQTLESLKKYLVEECYEELDAVDSGDPARIREELGDLLLQIVFQAQICSEAGHFGFEDVARAIADKLVRRHPHVFGDVRVEDAEEVVRNWDAIKRSEKGADEPASAVEGVPRHLPALRKADQVQARAARVGFDWEQTRQVMEKLDEEIAELKAALAGDRADEIRREIGDVLFTVVNLTRFVGCDAEEALNGTTAKFMRRFREVERRVHARGRTLTGCPLAELDALWNEVKADETAPDGGAATGESPRDA